MIPIADLFDFIESNFDFIIVADEAERIVRASGMYRADDDGRPRRLEGRTLEDVLIPSSLGSFRAGMRLARDGTRAVVVYATRSDPDRPIPMKAASATSDGGRIWLFFGSQLDTLHKFEEWEKDERVKELSCLYAVADWIETSRTVDEFFQKLPDLLARGMRFPERVQVYSEYQGRRYGEKADTSRYLGGKLVVARVVVGEIRITYVDAVEFLPEEQKMLNEICRMLSLALERKELREDLAAKQAEREDYARRFAALEQEISQRTRELEEQHKKLATINAAMERVNRGWEESRAWLATVFKAIPDEVALIDRNRHVVMANHAEGGEGRKCHEVFFQSEVPCRDCRLARIVRDKAPITLTIQHEERYLEVHALPIFSPDREVDGIMEFYRDVTLEKTYEQQLRQADRLASLGQLVSGIGHEINNPNQFIRGNIKILKQALEDMLPIVDAWYGEHPDLRIARLKYDFFRKHVMTLVDDMAHGSERIKGIVEGLKRFARRDDGLLIDQVDVNTLAQATARLCHNEVHKHAEIHLDLAPDIPPFTGNSQKIEQVLVNLVVNASQAMPDDRRGNITVRTRCQDRQVTIQVEDDGKGMNEQTRKQIFDPFFTTKRAKGGTGLGLAIAYRIVEEHGGAIAVSSTPGAGTTFTIQIPAAGGARPAEAGRTP